MALFRIPHLAIVALLGVAALAGCARLGPKTVAADRFDYSRSIAESWKQQTMLTIVKLRGGPERLPLITIPAQ